MFATLSYKQMTRLLFGKGSLSHLIWGSEYQPGLRNNMTTFENSSEMVLREGETD